MPSVAFCNNLLKDGGLCLLWKTTAGEVHIFRRSQLCVVLVLCLGFKSLQTDLFYGMVIGYTENTRYSACEVILHVSKIHRRLDRTLQTALSYKWFPKTPVNTRYCSSEGSLEQCIRERPELTSSLSTRARKVVLRNEDRWGLRSTIMRLVLCTIFMKEAIKHHYCHRNDLHVAFWPKYSVCVLHSIWTRWNSFAFKWSILKTEMGEIRIVRRINETLANAK